MENGDEQDHALVNVPDDSCRPYAVGRLSGFIASSILEAGPSVSEIACFSGQRNEAHIRGKADALFSTMKLLNADGSVMAEMTPPKASPEMAMSTPTLSPGTYLVEHRVLTTDGDVVKVIFLHGRRRPDFGKGHEESALFKQGVESRMPVALEK